MLGLFCAVAFVWESEYHHLRRAEQSSRDSGLALRARLFQARGVERQQLKCFALGECARSSGLYIRDPRLQVATATFTDHAH